MNPQWVSNIGRNSSNVAYALGDEESRFGIGDENGANSVSAVEAEDETGETVSNAISPRAASPNATVAMTITNSSGAIVEDGGELTTDATLGVVTYITSNIAVNVRDIKNFYVTVQAADGASQKLVGTRHSQEINGVGANVKPANFPDNTWGSALTPVTTSASNIDVTSLAYNTLPAYNTTPLQQSSVIGLADGTYNLKLVFAAKINADKPADSYGTRAMVSVVATPKELINYSIIYNGNGSTSGSVAAQAASSTATSYTFTVAAQGNLARAGYTFAGWAESSTATTPQYTAGVSKLTLASAAPVKTLYAIWRKNYTLTYNANGGVGGPGTVTANNTGVAHSFTVPGTIPTRDKYEFLGWADSSTATVAQYKVGNTITLQPTSTAKTVYAVWAAKPTTPLTNWNDLRYMQQMTPEACNSVATPDKSTTNVPAKQLIDSRDGKTYWVSKLADGNCWMTQNLDLDLNGVTLTPADSNVASNWVSTTGPSTNSGYDNSNYYRAQYYDLGYDYYVNGTTKNTGSEALAKDTTGNENAHWLIGNRYSWTAATAGTGNSGIPPLGESVGDAPSSICPKGWILPPSYSTTDPTFSELATAYGIISNAAGSIAMRSAPRYFIYGGQNNGSASILAGNTGWYWTSTVYEGSAYVLYLRNDAASPASASSHFRYVGLSVRCVVK